MLHNILNSLQATIITKINLNLHLFVHQWWCFSVRMWPQCLHHRHATVSTCVNDTTLNVLYTIYVPMIMHAFRDIHCVFRKEPYIYVCIKIHGHPY